MLLISNACDASYAPFCKHLFVENFTDAVTPVVPITTDNAHLLESGYEARTEYELPVFVTVLQHP